MASPSIKVILTEYHINSGRVDSGDECPVALAIKDALPDVDYLCVQGKFVKIDHWCYVLPTCAMRFILNYDLYLPVYPISFELRDGYVLSDRE